jgi:hypothetical protein
MKDEQINFDPTIMQYPSSLDGLMKEAFDTLKIGKSKKVTIPTEIEERMAQVLLQLWELDDSLWKAAWEDIGNFMILASKNCNTYIEAWLDIVEYMEVVAKEAKKP